MSKLFILLGALCMIFCCSDTRFFIHPKSPKIVLITIDGTRWQDIYDGPTPLDYPRQYTSQQLVPNLYKHFVSGGMAIGKESQALIKGPAHISMPSYLEIMRGYPSLDCLNNYCRTNNKPTLVNSFPHQSAVFAGWDTIAKVFDTQLAVTNIGKNIRSDSWSRLGLPEHPVEQDDFESNEYRPDLYTELSAIEYLKQEQPQFLWISLGDTDEWAHQGNVLMYWASLHMTDLFIGKLVEILDSNTVFIICPDHGRSDNFRDHGWDAASGRVWIMMRGPGIPNSGFVKYNRDVYLADIMSTVLELTSGTHSARSLLHQ